MLVGSWVRYWQFIRRQRNLQLSPQGATHGASSDNYLLMTSSAVTSGTANGYYSLDAQTIIVWFCSLSLFYFNLFLKYLSCVCSCMYNAGTHEPWHTWGGEKIAWGTGLYFPLLWDISCLFSPYNARSAGASFLRLSRLHFPTGKCWNYRLGSFCTPVLCGFWGFTFTFKFSCLRNKYFTQGAISLAWHCCLFTVEMSLVKLVGLINPFSKL